MLEGTLLSNRFLIGKYLDKGSQSKVYEVVDITNRKMPLVLKISPDLKCIFKEIQIVETINANLKNNTQIEGRGWQVPAIPYYGLIIMQG